MEIVIDIPEDIKVTIEQMGLLRIPNEMQKKVDKAIQHGTLLPKGHGRLIDADEVNERLNEINGMAELDMAFDVIENTPTIIEADAESEDEEV